MSDASGTVVNTNVSIQNVTADSLQVSVNGEIQEIKNTLDDLKMLMQKTGMQQFQSGNNIYNIGSITNATFSAEIGKKTFNMYLCRKLIEAISVYSDDAKDFLDTIRGADKADWETQKRYTGTASDCIISAFVGVVGKVLEKVFSAGKIAFSTNNSTDYTQACIITAVRTLQLLCFSFIAKLWDYKKSNNFEYNDKQLEVLKNFFTTIVELNITDHIELLSMLVSLFDELKIAYPFSEFDKDILSEGSNFIKACNNLQDINEKSDEGHAVYSTAFDAENNLADFLTALSFLVNYKMVAIKEITYNDIRNEDVQYLHSYTFLSPKNNQVASKFKYDARPVSNDAILIFKDNYQDGLNLFPFIIDVNALLNQPISRICFYTSFKKSKKSLTFSDNSIIASGANDDDADNANNSSQTMIQFNDEVDKDFGSNAGDVTELITDAGKFKNLQFNVVYKIFETAQNEILGKQENAQ